MPTDEADMTEPPTRGLHVLFVAWGFAPAQGPGPDRSLATVAALTRLGHRVTVLTADLATFDLATFDLATLDLADVDLATVDMANGADRSRLDDVPEGVRVVRVAMAPRARDPLLNRWSATRLADPKAWADTDHKNELRGYPEPTFGPWQPRAEATAARIHELEPVDLVIATGSPYVDFTVALRLHVDHGVPFVLDDRDSWLLDAATSEPRPLGDRILPWLEFALSQAVSMWFVSPPMAEWHRNRFPLYADRIRIVASAPSPEVAGTPAGGGNISASTLGSALNDALAAVAS